MLAISHCGGGAAAQPQHISHTLTQIRCNHTFSIGIQNQLIFHSKQKTCDSIVIAASKRMELYAAWVKRNAHKKCANEAIFSISEHRRWKHTHEAISLHFDGTKRKQKQKQQRNDCKESCGNSKSKLTVGCAFEMMWMKSIGRLFSESLKFPKSCGAICSVQ